MPGRSQQPGLASSIKQNSCIYHFTMLIFLYVNADNAHNIHSSIVKRWAFGFYVIELWFGKNHWP